MRLVSLLVSPAQLDRRRSSDKTQESLRKVACAHARPARNQLSSLAPDWLAAAIFAPDRCLPLIHSATTIEKCNEKDDNDSECRLRVEQKNETDAHPAGPAQILVQPPQERRLVCESLARRTPSRAQFGATHETSAPVSHQLLPNCSRV